MANYLLEETKFINDSIKKNRNKETSLIARFKKSNIIMLYLIAILLSIVAYIILDITALTIASSVSTSTADSYSSILTVEINKERTSLEQFSKSDAVINWFKDPTSENNIAKLTDAFTDFLYYSPDHNMWLGVENSGEIYTLNETNSGIEIVMTSELSALNPENDWYYECMRSVLPYTFKSDIEKTTLTKALWTNYKVYDENSNVLGVISIGIDYTNVFNDILKGLKESETEYIIDLNGNIILSSNDKYRIDTMQDIATLKSSSIYDEIPSKTLESYLHTIDVSNSFFTEDDETFTFINDASVIALSPIEGTKWLVLKESGKNEHLTMNTIIIVLFAFMIFLYAYSRIINGATNAIILNPFIKLSKDLKKQDFLQTNTETKIFGVGRRDELGLIATSITNLKRDLNIQTKNVEQKSAILRQNIDKLKRVYDAVPLAVLVFDSDLNLIKCNRNALTMFNVNNVRHFTEAYIHNDYLRNNNALFFERLDYANIIGSCFSEDLIKLSEKDSFWASLQIYYIQDDTEVNGYYEVFINDIHNVKEKEEMLMKQAYQDSLTGAWNRNYFKKLTNNEFDNIFNDDFISGMIVIDIDNFKNINDTYGHNIGDIVLAKVAASIMNVKEDEYFFRWGGEEFLILKPATTKEDIMYTAERTRKVVSSLIFEKVGSITISLGVALENDHDKNFEDIFKRADEALYKAKRSGKNKAIIQQNKIFYDIKGNRLS
ncbi:MAG: diguanylate cyclase [Lachnospirales bacterium]